MITINLFDSNFAHSKYEDGFLTATKGRKPQTIQYIEKQENFDGITVFTDAFITSYYVDTIQSKYKIAWLIEPPSIDPKIYQDIIKVEQKFDYIFTYDSNLIKRDPNRYKLCIFGGSQVSDAEWGIFDKPKNISIIASGKKFAEGHKLRHLIIKQLEGVDVWGTGYKKFEHKAEALKDYKYSIVIQNTRFDNYINEALLDCMAFGTIPIFWGCPNISEYFFPEAIVSFFSIADLQNIKLTEKIWREQYKWANNNLYIAKQYKSTDDNFCNALVKALNL